MSAPLLIAGATAVAAMAAYAEYRNASNTGQNSVVRAAVATAVQSVPLPGDVNIYRNVGVRPTERQITAWMTKVRRPESLRSSIVIVDRVRTSPYIDSDATRQSLEGFARECGEALSIGLPGGYILADLCSVETGAGIGSSPAMYNWNLGNTKLYSEGGRTLNPTPQLYFLVDNAPSVDMYESHPNFRAGVASWSRRTFGNARYNTRGPHGELGSLEALQAGDIEAFSAALGRGGYGGGGPGARNTYSSYPSTRPNGWVVSRYMNGRLRRLIAAGKLRSGVVTFRN